METGCHSLHRLKHRAVITLIIVFSLLFYVLCMHVHYYHRTLETIGLLKSVDQETQQKALYRLFTDSLEEKDGKYVLMKNGYKFSGQYFLFFDSFTIGISIGYSIILILVLYVYKNYVKNETIRAKKELNYLMRELEHYIFSSPIIRENGYKECNYLLDRLEQRVNDMSYSNQSELNRILNFHQNIIHQINTPLNTIKILIEHLYDEDKIERCYLDNMNYAIEKTSGLTRMYLRYSKLDTGKVKYHFEKIDLYELLEDVFCTLTIYADYYHTILINKCDDSIIYADAIWIKEAIENVVKNCIENAGNYNKILVSSKSSDDMTIIYIDDIGNVDIDIESINFERFESSQSGIGIGLHLCKQIVEAHLGDIVVKKFSKGGLRFIITIPNQPKKIKIKTEE